MLVSDATYAYARKTDRATVIVIFNNSSKPTSIEFDVTPTRLQDGTRLEDRLGLVPHVEVQLGKLRLVLPVRTACALTEKRA